MSEAACSRVLYVHHRPEVSGAARALALLIRELDRSRFDPYVLTPAGPAADLFRAAGAKTSAGPVACFTHIWASTYHGTRWALLGRELARLPAAHRRLARTLAVEPAIVHLNDSPLVHAAWQAGRVGVPVVWHLRSALPTGGQDARSRLIRRTTERLAVRTVAINEDVAASFRVGAAVVSDPVDLERFRPGDAEAERRSLGLPDAPTVSFFGYLYPAKGFREFLRAASALSSRGVDARFLVVGGGVRGARFFDSAYGRVLSAAGVAADYERQARDLVEDLRLGDVVRFVPYVDDPAPFYRASDVVVAPSRGPEVGLPVLEAAASGVPVVATGSAAGGGVLVPGETGLLVPQGRVSDLVEAIGGLLEDGDLRAKLGRAGRSHAQSRFDSSAHARAIEGLYEQVLAAGSRRASSAAALPATEAGNGGAGRG